MEPIAPRSQGRPKNRWEDDVLNNIKQILKTGGGASMIG
jgi:hypothetical protein